MLFNVDAPAAAITEYERLMRINEDVLRYLTIRVDEHEKGQSSILQNKGRPGGRGDRPDRGDRGGRFDSGRSRGPAETKSEGGNGGADPPAKKEGES
jgi:small subunit ribosomal protein S6